MAVISFLKKNNTAPVNGTVDKKTNSSKRKYIFFIVIFFLLLLLLLFLFLYYRSNKTYSSFDVLSTSTLESSVVANYMAYGDNILKYSKDGISCYNAQNEMTWNQTFEMQEPMVAICDDYIAVGDYKGSKIYIMNQSGPLGEIDAMKPIIQLDVSGQGMVSVVLDDNEITWIYFYDYAGEEIAKMRTTLNDSGYPLAISLSEDGLKFGVSYLQVKNGVLSTSIAFYNFGSVGQNEVDNFVSGYDYPNMAAPLLTFLDNSTAIAVGDNKLLFYKGTQKPLLLKELELEEEVQDVFYNNKYVALVFKGDETDAKYRLDLYDNAGNLVWQQPFNIDFKEIVINNEEIILYNEEELEIYRLNGVKKFDGKLNISAQKIIPLDGSTKFQIITNDSIQMIKLK